MKLKKGKGVNHAFHAAAMLPAAVLSVGLTVPATVVHASIQTPDEIIVTARRTEEVIQNIPISMTVFNQDMLNERNVTNGADLAAYTPSLSVNTRFGADQTTFAIRGFTQELRTTASVAVYFADVVAPRGGGSITSGDGAGPGAFFDLQNVQILKGPQGTLFGRNTTGGAIQLVPQEPTTKLEGYAELSDGNYNMHRAQGVINVPLTDSARARFGIDALRRDGYIENQSGIGPDRFANVNYVSGRASLMLNVTDSVQNYTILSYTHSKNNGSIMPLYACGPGLFAAKCAATLAQQGSGFYNVENEVDNPVAELKQWQAINTTTWNLSDNVTFKNIFSAAGLKQDMRSAVFGSDFGISTGVQSTYMFPSLQLPGVHSNNQVTYVEELQLQGTSLAGKLQWQGGLYFENSRPGDWAGTQSPGMATCTGTLGWDPASWNCSNNVSGFGSVERQLWKIDYKNEAVYSQATYEFTDEFRVTGGLRYTLDRTLANTQRTTWFFNSTSYGSPDPAQTKCSLSDASFSGNCNSRMSQRSEAPTWLIDFDYLPSPDILLYAKYARGYRQGSVVTSAPDGVNSYNPEKVDAFELGAKTSFHAVVPGTFNVALFYNKLKDQQIQEGYFPLAGGASTTAIINAGASTIQGVEAETVLRLLDDLVFNLSYTYLETRLDTLDSSSVPIPAGWAGIATAFEGGHLTFSPRHTVTTGLSYRLPLPAEVGDVSLGGSYTFIDQQISSDSSAYGVLSSRRMVSLNMGWKAIYGSPFDASLFVTNAMNEKDTTYVPGLYTQTGAEFRVLGEPRMMGARVKYSF